MAEYNPKRGSTWNYGAKHRGSYSYSLEFSNGLECLRINEKEQYLIRSE